MNRRTGIGRLAIRHALLAAVLGVTIGLGFSVLQVGDDDRASVAAERREILQMLAVMREPAAQACNNLNTQAAQVVVQGALSYVPVQSARLVSDFGETLAQGRHDAAAATGADAWWTRFIAPTQSYSLPLSFGAAHKHVGELTVVTAQAPRVERFLQGTWRDMGVNVWRGVTVALALGVLSFVTLTRPLTAIARRIGHGASGLADAAPLAEARRRDEIGEIASVFQRYEREAGERTRSLQASAQALADSEAELRAANARLTAMVADLERHKSDMALIAELNELLQSARTEDEAFDVIRTAAARLFADIGGGFAVAGEGDTMLVVGAWGVTGGLHASDHRGECWAIRRGGPHLQLPQQGVHCTHQAADLPTDAASATLCTPLSVDGELLGVLHLHGGGDEAAFGASVQQRVEVFGEVVKLGLSNLRLRDTLREQALRDVLTGLPNRRLFDETLPRELARCLRTGQPLTVAVIDVDHFKHFNDSDGHDAGDQVLRTVAQALGRAIRASDLACRYGGDEFMCLLPGMSAPDAAARFERALRQLADDAGDAPLPGETVTFTVGLATAPGCGTDAATLVRAADAALYVAKEKGRNRVEVAAPVVVALKQVG
ncbi:MAG TPA: diguanylate cyclase [Aquabacterium sp.]|nr:diguanylate cyclase [Aquabacterium sp.]